MSNSFYTHGAFPSTGSAATSASMRAELDLISAGFDKMPTLSGNANLFVVINSTGTGLTQTSTLPSATFTDTLFTIQDDGDNTRKFQFNASTVTPGATRIYSVPDANTTLVGTDTTQTLTNKTLTAPVISSIVNTGSLSLPTSTDTLVGRATTDTLTNKTLTSPVIATIVNTGTLTLPTSTDTLVGRATTDTLTNKTLTSPVIGTIVNTGTLTLPTSTDTLVGRATTDTLTNKTLTSPVIATIVNTGTLTLPTSTDTLVGRATTDTLTNKTLTSPVIATIVNTGTLTLPTSTDTLVGRATTDTLTNKTLGAFTISGTVSGGGNQINNVIIGASTPLAGSFTTLSTTGLASLPSTGRSAAAALTVTNPAFLYGVASTYTDTASSGTIAAMAPFYSISGPTLSTSNVTTYTNAATLYIANAPTAGGSATITNPYAVYVAAGAAYFGGAVTFAGSASLAGLTVTSLTNSGLTSGRVVYTTTGGLETSSANLTFNGTTLTANTIGAFTLSGTVAGGGNQINNVIIGTSTPLAGAFTTLSASTSITNTGLTSGRVVYSTTGGLETDSAGLTFDGTNFATTGTATATKLIPTGSSATGNGLYLPAANSLGLSTNGTNAVYIDSSQNVGIGGAPAYKLDVTSSAFIGSRLAAATGTNGVSQIYTNTGGTFSIGIDSSTGANFGAAYGGFLWHAGAYPLLFGTSNQERIRITSGGVVGILTNIPATFANALAVQGTTALVGNASFTSSNPTYQGILRLIENPTTIASTGGLEFFTSNFGSGYGWKMTSIDSSGVQLTFATRQGSATWSEVMRLDSSGNVGIGTSSGSARLNVNGGTGTSQIRWEVNSATFVNEVSTNAAVNAYVYKQYDALYHVWKISSSTAMVLDTSGRMYMSSNAAYGNAKITLVPATNPTTGLSTNSQIQIGEATSNSAYCLNIGYGLFGDYYGYIQSKNNSVVASLLLNPDGGNVGIGTTSPVYRLAVTGANNTGIASFSGNNNGALPGSDGDATLVIGGNYAAGSGEIDYFHNNSTFKGTIGGHRFLQRTGASTVRDLMWLTENLATFYTGSAERIRIDSAGNVTLQKNISVGAAAPTTSGAGITFPATQSASTNANTLDDYEEGTWTPVIASSGTQPTVSSYAIREGIYTKVGNMVTVACSIQATITNIGTGNPQITGLPFASGGVSYHGVSVGFRNLFSLMVDYDARIYSSGTYVEFSGSTYGLTASTYLTFWVTYSVA